MFCLNQQYMQQITIIFIIILECTYTVCCAHIKKNNEKLRDFFMETDCDQKLVLSFCSVVCLSCKLRRLILVASTFAHLPSTTTVGFQSSQNIIVRRWVYMSFIIIWIHRGWKGPFNYFQLCY